MIATESESLKEVSWEQDYLRRMNPNLVTGLLRASVPILDHVGWEVLRVEEGYARTRLPLRDQSSNQHASHQAALLVLAADYTGGTALASLFRGCPIAGVHPRQADDGAALWLTNVSIKYIAPSTDDLILECRVPSDRVPVIRQRFQAGKRVVEELEVELESDGRPVASATMGYFAQKLDALQQNGSDRRPSTLATHKAKSSARLIAAVRATENEQPDPLYSDPYSSRVAGAQGRVMSRRFLSRLPELRDMVAARTRDLDDRMSDAVNAGVRQVVTVGAGLDVRPFRLFTDRLDLTFFELDLPEMLAERERALVALDDLPCLDRQAVKIDLRHDDLSSVLLSSEAFDPACPTFFIYEGVSMYLSEEVNRRALSAMAGLLRDPRSRLWIDLVSRSAIERRAVYPGSEEFLDAMDELGEPFVFGIDNPEREFAECGLAIERSTPSSAFVETAPGSIFGQYHFYTLSRHR
jgi:methyltransferase (TIGR00027 family)